jgi:hypothetical protein
MSTGLIVAGVLGLAGLIGGILLIDTGDDLNIPQGGYNPDA